MRNTRLQQSEALNRQLDRRPFSTYAVKSFGHRSPWGRLTFVGILLVLAFNAPILWASDERPSVDVLIQELSSPSGAVRGRAAQALAESGSKAEPAAEALVRGLKDPDDDVRWKINRALIAIGRPAVDALTQGLHHSDSMIRRESAFALGRIGRPAASAVASLTQALEDSHADVRRYAAFALGRIGSSARSAVPVLKAMAADSDTALAKAAREALTRIGDPDNDPVARNEANAVRRSHPKLSPASPTLDENSSQKPVVENLQPEIENAVLRAVPQTRFDWKPITARIRQVPWLAAAAQLGIWLAFWIFLWTAVLAIEPLWLWMADEWLWRHARWQSPRWLGGWSLTPGTICGLGYFARRRRVLDAWIRSRIATARENFGNQSASRHRNVCLTLPLKFQGREIDKLSAHHLAAASHPNSMRLAVTGAGGTGKTMLAYQIADWCLQGQLGGPRMLPVVINDEPEQSLIEAVCEQLSESIGSSRVLSRRWLDRLIQSQRILIIVDDAPQISRRVNEELPATAVIHVARAEEAVPPTELRVQTCRLAGDHLTSFLSQYFTARELRDQFADVDLFEACRRMSVLTVGGEPSAWLATMYAEHLIAARDDAERQSVRTVLRHPGAFPRELPQLKQAAPQHMPELVRAYLRAVIGSNESASLANTAVHDLEEIAWMSLETSGTPRTVNRTAVLAKLGYDAAERLEFLLNAPGLLHFSGTGEQRIRIGSRTLAEYLAAMYAVRVLGGSHRRWKDLLARIDRQSVASSTQTGLLHALWDCCLASADAIPEFVLPELGRRCGLQPEVVERVRVPLQVRRLVFGLKSLDPVIRESSARELARFGSAAGEAIPVLIEALRDEDVGRTAADALRNIGLEAVVPLARGLDSEHHQIRRLAAATLGQIGPEAHAAVAALRAALNDGHHMVRANAVKALALIDPDECVSPLIDALRDEHGFVVATAVCALGRLGSHAAAAAPSLARMLRHSLVEVRRLTVDTLGRIGPAANPAVPFLIKALRDQSWEVRADTAKALGLLGPEAIAVLLDALNSPDPDTRASAAFAMGVIRPEGRSAIRALIIALKDPYETVRLAATEALERIHRQEREPAAAIPFVPRSMEESLPRPFVARAA